MTPLSSFDTLLAQHDWWFAYADSFSVYDRGLTERLLIQQIAEESADHKALMQAWKKYREESHCGRESRAALDVVRARLLPCEVAA
jgi:hypothetical protein